MWLSDRLKASPPRSSIHWARALPHAALVRPLAAYTRPEESPASLHRKSSCGAASAWPNAAVPLNPLSAEMFSPAKVQKGECKDGARGAAYLSPMVQQDLGRARSWRGGSPAGMARVAIAPRARDKLSNSKGMARSHPLGRRAKKFIAVNDNTTSSTWSRASTAECTSPRSGFERDVRASATVTRMRRRSPGRTGRGHRISSWPGEARLATWEM